MIIIPARLKSSRFEHKVLADIAGFPMVVRVAKQVQSLDRVVVATDSKRVIDVAKKFNIEAVLTKESHTSGTDRVNEACDILELKDSEVVINLQADEPFIEKEVVESLIERAKRVEDELIVSCYRTINSDMADDPNVVKVILDSNSNAIYFSRSKIPYNREHTDIEYLGHLGIYGFKRGALREFCNLTQSPLENIEKLEQLRAIYHSKKVAMIEVQTQSFGIDTEADLKRALEIFG